MEHNHTHQCCCKHENVKYCPKCQVTYCLDCGREWFDKCTLNHSYSWYSGTITPITYKYETTCQATADNTICNHN
jgi:hypothetical protein